MKTSTSKTEERKREGERESKQAGRQAGISEEVKTISNVVFDHFLKF